MRPDITATEQSLYFDDPPCITILKEKKLRAKLDHTCSCCRNRIRSGEEYMYYFVKDYDAIPPRAFAAHTHIICPICDDIVCPITGELR